MSEFSAILCQHCGKTFRGFRGHDLLCSEHYEDFVNYYDPEFVIINGERY